MVCSSLPSIDLSLFTGSAAKRSEGLTIQTKETKEALDTKATVEEAKEDEWTRDKKEKDVANEIKRLLELLKLTL